MGDEEIGITKDSKVC